MTGKRSRPRGAVAPRVVWGLTAAVAAVVLAVAAWRLLSRTAAPTPASSESAATAAGSAGAAAPVPRGRRDVVLVTVDTLRADHLPAYGYAALDTPAYDGLAREGVRFANAATTVPFTLPAHSSIMTGRYPPGHGVRENVGYSLDPSLPTLAGVLADAGWATAGFVSAFVLDGRWGIGRGFATYFDHFDLKGMERADLGSVSRDGGETVGAAIDWLDHGRPRDRPFLLWLHLYDPHDPYTPPEPYRSRYPGRPYDGEIAYTDDLLGRLRAALAERGLFDGSLLVLTADHGEGLGDHGEAFHGFFVYDSTVHVPLIVRLPGGDGGGRVVGSAVSHVDLLPTILDLVGVASPAGVQGRSLAPLLAGGEEPGREVYSESLYPLLHYGWAPLRALRADDLKLIAAPRPELYDVESDPREESNLLAARRDDGRRLARDLTALRERIETGAPAAAKTEPDEEALAQLRALGYVAGRGGVDPSQEDEVERADPKDKIAVHRLIMSAQSAIGGGDEAAAAERLREVLAQDPGILDAHQMLGSIAAQAGRSEEALGHFRRALELDSEHRASLFGLAAAYRAMGKSKEALVGFERLLALNPRDGKAALATADLMMAGGDRAGARRVLEAAVAGQTPAAILLGRLGEVLALAGEPGAARARLEAAIAANPKLAPPHFNLAVLLEEGGDADGAVTHYLRAIELQPKYYQAQFNLGRLFGRLGDAAGAERQLAAAIDSNPDFVQGYLFLGKLAMDRGELARAEELAREGLARDREGRSGPLGWLLLADVLNRAGRPREAAEAVRRGQEIRARGGAAEGAG